MPFSPARLQRSGSKATLGSFLEPSLSDTHSPDAAPNPTLVNNNTVDALVATVLFVGGVVVIIEARRLGAGWTTDGPGAGYFPFYIGLALLAAAVALLISGAGRLSVDATLAARATAR